MLDTNALVAGGTTSLLESWPAWIELTLFCLAFISFYFIFA